MSIEGRSPGGALREFERRLQRLLNQTLTPTPLSAAIREYSTGEVTGAAWLTFREAGRPRPVSIRTKYGALHLFIFQRCETTRAPREGLRGRIRPPHRVRTAEYRYTIAAPGEREPIFRWEYLRRWPNDGDRWCRHHLQGPVTVPLGDGVSMNDLHLPTGYVPVEDVIRFCIVDLETPPLSNGWHETLVKSYEQFRKESMPPG